MNAATETQSSSAAIPRWKGRRGLARYREFIFFGAMLALIVILSIAERIDPSLSKVGLVGAGKPLEWLILPLAAFVAEIAILYAAWKAVLYLWRDREQAKTRSIMTGAAALLLVVTFIALWPREPLYTSRFNDSTYADPPFFGFLFSDNEGRLPFT
jgi:hypothetical protein